MYSSVAAAELVMLAAAGTAAALFWRYHRPGDARGGMATRTDAQRVRRGVPVGHVGIGALH